MGDINKLFGKVSSEWMSEGEWFANAWKRFPSELLDLAQRAATEFAADDGPEHENLQLDCADVFAAEYQGIDERKKAAARKFCSFRNLAQIEILRRLRGAPGYLVAFGSPERRGTPHEWISCFAWQGLNPIPGKQNAVSGDGNIYYDVRVIDPSAYPAVDENVTSLAHAKGQQRTSQADLERFVSNYVDKTKSTGNTPSQQGLLAAWKAASHSGKRTELIAEFKVQRGQEAPTRGRPRKIAT